MIEDADLSVAAASKLIARRELSPLELTQYCLDRIELLNDKIQAFLSVDREGALETARTLAVAGGPDGLPLNGIPFAIKDIIDVAGLPTTASSRVLEDNVASEDAAVVEMLRDAGVVLLGKTNTHEFAYGVVTAPTSNPWDVDRIPGGSSGGSAAAVASGMAPAAIGTDTAGSIRIPSAMCGVSGLMPRSSGLPMDGIIPLARSLDRCGPIARDADDLALIWTTLVGDADIRLPAPKEFVVAAPAAPSDIGEIDAEVESRVEEAIEVLVGLGAGRVTTELPHLEEWDFPRAVPLMLEALEAHTMAGWYPDRSDEYQTTTADALRFAEGLPDDALETATEVLRHLKDRLTSAVDEADVLILPTTPIPAPTKEESEGTSDGAHRPFVTRTLTRICGPINHCDLAAAAIPCGYTTGGLPIGLQIVGRTERTVLEAALLYQSATDWHARRPPLPSR
jgi:aspartyl-tRNA(Asn)/glutamyl-tRNA(Gln) amidotransferase subunit A